MTTESAERLPNGASAAEPRSMPPSSLASAQVQLDAPGLLRLLALSSSLCPIGAFAYSQGLETAVERGWVTSELALAEWITGLGAHGLALLDLPLLIRAHAAWRAGDTDRALAIAERMHANREARELLEQERQLGSALASVLANLGVAAARPLCGNPRASYVVSYALGAVHFGIGPDVAALGYAFAWAEQQANAAARLIPLGHMATQRVLSQVLNQVPAWVERASGLPDVEIGSSTPGLAMSGAWHEAQYTRLFRS